MRRIGIFLILCVIATDFCFGQLPHTFTQYTSEDGLSQNTIMSILQDDKGVMWFATWDGLYKFDGYTFNNYKAHPGDSIGLSNNRLDNIKEDRYGYIWVQSYNHQVYRSIRGLNGSRLSLTTTICLWTCMCFHVETYG